MKTDDEASTGAKTSLDPPNDADIPYAKELGYLDPEWTEKLRSTDAILEYARVVRWIEESQRAARAESIAVALYTAKTRWLSNRPEYDAASLASSSPSLLEEYRAADAKRFAAYAAERFEFLSKALPEIEPSELAARIGR